MTWLGHKIFFTFSRAQFFKNLHQKWTSKTAIRHLYISHDAPHLPPPPPKFCITFVFHFSCVLQPSQEKLNTMLMQNVYWGLGGGGANKMHYGKCGNGEVQKYNSFPCSVLLSTIEMTSNCSKLCRETIRLICKHFDLNSMVKSMENCCRMVNWPHGEQLNKFQTAF